MSKRPTDHLEPSAKKRGNTRQLTKDDASDEDEEPEAHGEFRQASEAVMKTRRIVRPKRGVGNLATTNTTTAASSNPFSGISLTGGATANPFAGVNLLAPGANGNAFVQFKQVPAVAPEVTTAVASKPADQSLQTPAQTADTSADAPANSRTDGTQDNRTAAAAAGTSSIKQPAAKAPDSNLQQPTATQTEGKKEGSSQPTAAALVAPVSADFSSFVASNKQESPFAVQASGESAAFGNAASGTGFGGTSGGFTSSAGGFGAVGASVGGFGSTRGAFGALGTGNAAFGKAGEPKDTTKAEGASFSFHPEASTAADNGTSQVSAAESPSTSPVQQRLPPDQAATTGEEGETVLYEAEGTLFQFDDQDTKTWREKGRGELRVNKAPSGQSRLVMRQRGNLRLLLNANLWPKMPISLMDGGKGVSFPCINHARMEESEDNAKDASEESKHVPKLASFAFRKKLVSKLEELVRVVEKETLPDAAV